MSMRLTVNPKMEGVATKLLGRNTLRPHWQKFDILTTKIYERVEFDRPGERSPE